MQRKKSLGFAVRIALWYWALAVTHDAVELSFTIPADCDSSLQYLRCRRRRSCCLPRAAMAESFCGELPSWRAVFGSEALPVVTAAACLVALVPG